MDLNVDIDGIIVEIHPVVAAIHGFQLLLGNDALRQLKSIRVNYEQEQPTFLTGGIDFDLFSEEKEKARLQSDRIICRESQSIPARSVAFFTVEVKGGGLIPDDCMLEPSSQLMIKKSVSVGRLLLPAGCGCFPNIQFVNFSNTRQFLPKGIVVGTIIPIQCESNDESDGQQPQEKKQSLDFDSAISNELSAEEHQVVLNLLERYSACFATSTSDRGVTTIVKHRIDTGNNPPVHQPPYKSAWKERELIQTQVQEMLKDDVIEPSTSPWAAPVVLVKKKDGGWRFCVDYRRLNSLTTRDVYPLPRIEDALSRLEGAQFFSIMDMQSGYWQVEMEPADRIKTAFVTADGLYQFKVMPFGLTNAPSTFQRMVDVLLAGLKWHICLVYLDDIVIFSTTFAEHLERLEIILKRILEAGIRLKLSKCTFFAICLKILGYIVGRKGLSPDPVKVSAVQDFPTPTSVKNVQSFVGLCSYYRRFIQHFAMIAKPLTDLTKKNRPFVWASEQQASFDSLKKALTSPPILCHPNYELPMEIHCDACGYGIGAVLVQRHDGKERVIAYTSCLLDSAEQNYSITEKECLALVRAVQRFRIYIWGMKIRVITDHHSLCWLMKKKDLAGRLARWSLLLQDLDIEIVHKSGKLHQDADALSRHPVDPPGQEEEIPMLSFQSITSNFPTIGAAQRESSWWSQIIAGLEENNPSKHIQKLTRNYELKNGVLFHKLFKDGRVFLCLCLPQSFIEQVLLACHDDMTAGHLGTTRTIDKVRKRYYWPKMQKDIIRYVKTCVDCQTKKRPLERPAGLMTPITSQKPFERIGLDLIGPFPLSKSRNRYVIIAVDYFTKWVIAKAIPNSTTKEVVDFFVKRVVLQHGAPSFLISDRGKSLKSNFAEELFRAMQTNHLVTTAYHPQCNGLVERFNHTFAMMLSMYVNAKHDDWDESIDYVIFGYNTSRHESTGESPFYLLYGREAVLPIDVSLGNNPDSNGITQNIVSDLINIREKVKRRMLMVHARQKKRYDKRHKDKAYHIGDVVLVYRPIRKKGRAEKLLHRYHGPFRVVNKINSLNYTVESLYGSRKHRDCVHVSMLKPFHNRETLK